MLKRDISLTLIIKFTLLFILWYLCFSKAHKPNIHVESWFFNSQAIRALSDSPPTHS